jgi:chromate transporter
MSTSLAPADWIGLFTHFTALSLLAVGGVITTVPDMQRYLVADQHWLTDSQFTSSIALAQAAPGPNVLFVALMGWNVGERRRRPRQAHGVSTGAAQVAAA